jgi:NAD(P)-dependent dehydrogenase (short-subunit alcohol dehydrogenase family)
VQPLTDEQNGIETHSLSGTTDNRSDFAVIEKSNTRFNYFIHGFGYIKNFNSNQFCTIILKTKNLKMEIKKVWFVTGASKGLGLSLTKLLLSDGFNVVATSRRIESLIKAISVNTERFLPIELNITSDQDVKNAIQKGIETFGRIDVVVNNAGYGQFGSLEELTYEEARENYDVNVFGLLNVIRNVMPHFRANKSGYFFNISSIGGYTGNFVGAGIYCSTKFAVSGITETLEAEGRAFGIKTTLVYPGYFRTNFLSSDSIKIPQNPIEIYEEARKSERFHLDEMNGNQPGNPEKLAQVLLQISKESNPPLHLFLGQDAYDGANAKIQAVKEELQKWKDYTFSTSF